MAILISSNLFFVEEVPSGKSTTVPTKRLLLFLEIISLAKNDIISSNHN